MRRLEISAENFKSLTSIVDDLISSGEEDITLSFTPNTGKYLKLSEMEMKIKKCLDKGDRNGICIKIENVPHCFLKNCEEHIKKSDTKGKIKGRICRNCEFFQRCEGIWETYIEIHGWDEIILNKPLQDFPKEIPIEVTLKCNLSCNFCFNKNYNMSIKELDTANLSKIIDNISNSGIDIIRFTGGEPLIRKDIFVLLEYAKSKGLYIILNTNATLINENNIEKIVKYVDNVLIPLEGFDNTSESKVTGYKNSFKKKITAIKLLKKFGVRKIRCGTVATKENINNLEKIFEIVRELGVDDWELYRPIPTRKNTTPINTEDVKILVEKLIKFNSEYENTFIANAIPFCSYDPEKIRDVAIGANSDDGHSRIVVGADGKVKPSYFLSETIGNALEDDIIKSWNHPFVKKIRDLKSVPKECKKCKYLKCCKGGSRFAAKLIHDSYDAMDPLAQPRNIKSY